MSTENKSKTSKAQELLEKLGKILTKQEDSSQDDANIDENNTEDNKNKGEA